MMRISVSNLSGGLSFPKSSNRTPGYPRDAKDARSARSSWLDHHDDSLGLDEPLSCSDPEFSSRGRVNLKPKFALRVELQKWQCSILTLCKQWFRQERTRIQKGWPTDLPLLRTFYCFVPGHLCTLRAIYLERSLVCMYFVWKVYAEPPRQQ